MNDTDNIRTPRAAAGILRRTRETGFAMASEPQTGALLRALAASKPGGRFLELGTGTGYGAAWILEGMDARASLDSVDVDPAVQAVAREHLGGDPRLKLFTQDALSFLASHSAASYDFIFADALAGKFDGLELTLALLAPGGILLLDDLLPQPNWPEGHAPRVAQLLARLERLDGFQVTFMRWSSGIVLVTRPAGVISSANPGETPHL